MKNGRSSSMTTPALSEECKCETWVKWASFDDLPDHTRRLESDYDVETAKAPNLIWKNVMAEAFLREIACDPA